MAISNLLPRKTMGSKSLAQTLRDRNDYDQNPVKTENGAWVTSYECLPESAADEFLISKQLYEAMTGRSQPKKRDIIMYRIIQSFKPGEVSPEEANKIAYELAMAFTKGKHQFVVSTHTDKNHIHSHIEFNSTNLSCDGKFNNFKNSAFVLRELNDKLCLEHGLSVIKNPKKRAKLPREMGAIQYGDSFKERLRQTIDKVLPDCMDFDEFLARMRTEGYEVKTGKRLAFRAADQERFTRAFRLGDDFTEAALRERVSAPRGRTAAPKKPPKRDGKKVNLLIDIQAKMQAGKSGGYERWAKLFNLKEAAKTLNFLTDNGITDYDELTAKAEEAGEKFDAVSHRIKQIEGRMGAVAALKTNIINYSKTRNVYTEYKKSRHKKAFRAKHENELALHEAAKAAFDALGGAQIPKVAQLQEEYTALLSEKKERYEEYKTAKKEMLDYLTMKQNIDKILNIPPPEREPQQRKKEQEADR